MPPCPLYHGFSSQIRACANEILERFQAKWRPVRVKKTRQIKNLEPRFDFHRNGKGSSSLLKNPEVEGFLVLAGRYWGDAAELDVIF
jgi:hypothetical protein